MVKSCLVQAKSFLIHALHFKFPLPLASQFGVHVTTGKICNVRGKELISLCKLVHFRTKPSQTKLFETRQLVGETTLFLFHIGKKIWILDWRIHSGLARIVPANVDLKARVRRERQESGRPEVPLKSFVRFPASCLTVNKNVAALFVPVVSNHRDVLKNSLSASK